MELVKGVPITDFCDQNQLTPRQRLALFVSVCQAVQHAHQKGIIHRDLKPSNVLVTMQDGTPLVKVIDFGIAKALGQQLTDKTMFTGFAQMVGTPAYMSPEQVALSNVDVDTRSDVYSLGVLLYELLTGTTPLVKERLKEISYDELRRIIREEEPPKPSTRISTLGQASTTISTQRKSDPKRLSLLLRGELDWIVMKALDKDRNRRYESASAFAADVQRYLNNEAVQACPPSAVYRFRKFARRNKVAFAFTAVILFFVFALGGGVAWTLGERSARQGEAEAKILEALKVADAGLRQGNPYDARLVEAVEQIKSQLANIGHNSALREQAQEIIRDFDMARELEEARLEQTAVKDGHYDAEPADAAYVAAFAKYGLDLDELAIEIAAEKIRLRPIHWQLVGALDQWTFIRTQLKRDGWSRRLAVARAADPDPARQRLRDFLEGKNAEIHMVSGQAENWPVPTLLLVARLAKNTPFSASAATLLEKVQQKYPGDFWINDTLSLLLKDSQPPRLEDVIRFRSVAVALRPQSPGARFNLGGALEENGQLDKAIAEYREAIRLKKDYCEAHKNLSNALLEVGQLDEAIIASRYALRLNKDYAEAHLTLGNALWEKGHLDDAIAEFREALRLKKNYAEAHVSLGGILAKKGELDKAIGELREALRLKKDYAHAHANLGNALTEKGQVDEGIAEYRKAFRLKKTISKIDLALLHGGFGQALWKKGQLDEAIAQFREALRLNKDLPGARYGLSSVLREKGRKDEAVAEAREALRLKKDFPEAHYGLAAALYEKGELDEAIAEFREAIRLKKDYSDAHSSLGGVLCAKGQLDEAIAECREAIRLKKDEPTAHNNLGAALMDKGRLGEAIAEYREAIRLKKDFPEAHNNLGNALRRNNQLAEAIAEYREAIRLNKEYSGAHVNLGQAFVEKGELEQAIHEFKQAVQLDSGCAAGFHELAGALRARGKEAEAEKAYRQALALRQKLVDDFPGRPGHHSDLGATQNDLASLFREKGKLAEARALVEQAIRHQQTALKVSPEHQTYRRFLRNHYTVLTETLIGLGEHRRAAEAAEQVPRFSSTVWQDNIASAKVLQYCIALAGKDPKLSEDEREALVKHYAHLSAGFYTQAFAARPALATNGFHRYNAACAAALAGCGKDAANLDDKEKRRLRDQALSWLRADLERFDKQQRAGNLPGLLFLLQHLAHAQKDPDFKGVRDSLDSLPESEQAAWRKHWADTYRLLKKVRGDLIQTTLQGVLTDKAHQQSHEQQLEAGKQYVIDMTSKAFDTYLKLLDPKGNLVAENDDIAPNNLNLRIIYTPKETGTFRIVATSFQERGRGAYTVTITTLKGKGDKKSP
jgi:tetratricopeptide (TPR) repeat protein